MRDCMGLCTDFHISRRSDCLVACLTMHGPARHLGCPALLRQTTTQLMPPEPDAVLVDGLSEGNWVCEVKDRCITS